MKPEYDRFCEIKFKPYNIYLGSEALKVTYLKTDQNVKVSLVLTGTEMSQTCQKENRAGILIYRRKP